MTSYLVRSALDPSRLLEYRDDWPAQSVRGLDAADHVLMSEDSSQGHVLSAAPARRVALPSRIRRAAIQAVAHVLVYLLNPRAVASPLLDEHLQEHARGEVGRLKGRKHSFLINGARLEILDLGHVATLRLHRSATKARRPAARESGAQA